MYVLPYMPSARICPNLPNGVSGGMSLYRMFFYPDFCYNKCIS